MAININTTQPNIRIFREKKNYLCSGLSALGSIGPHPLNKVKHQKCNLHTAKLSHCRESENAWFTNFKITIVNPSPSPCYLKLKLERPILQFCWFTLIPSHIPHRHQQNHHHHHLGHTLEHRTTPISSVHMSCSTRLHRAIHQDFYRSCDPQCHQICVCEAFVLTISDNPVQKPSLLVFQCNSYQLYLFHQYSDNLAISFLVRDSHTHTHSIIFVIINIIPPWWHFGTSHNSHLFFLSMV